MELNKMENTQAALLESFLEKQDLKIRKFFRKNMLVQVY